MSIQALDISRVDLRGILGFDPDVLPDWDVMEDWNLRNGAWRKRDQVMVQNDRSFFYGGTTFEAGLPFTIGRIRYSVEGTDKSELVEFRHYVIIHALVIDLRTESGSWEGPKGDPHLN